MNRTNLVCMNKLIDLYLYIVLDDKYIIILLFIIIQILYNF